MAKMRGERERERDQDEGSNGEKVGWRQYECPVKREIHFFPFTWQASKEYMNNNFCYNNMKNKKLKPEKTK